MNKPRVRRKGTEQTISATDEEWAEVRAGAKEARMSVSAWAVHCALTVDPFPRKHRRLVLDEKQQRSMTRAVGEHARSLIADIDAPSQFVDDLGAFMKAGLETMVREGRGSEVEALLRQVLGGERATLIAAALTANVPAAPASAPAPQEKAPRRKKPGRRNLGQGDLFGSPSGSSGEHAPGRGERGRRVDPSEPPLSRGSGSKYGDDSDDVA